VGLLPLRVLTDAADHYLRKQQRSLGISEAEKVKIAVKSLGLDDLAPFNPQERVIEYIISDATREPLLAMNLRQFADETASESPAPGGGSIAAYCGALGASLTTMVANLSAHKRGWDARWEAFSEVAERGMALQKQLLALVDADTAAFNQIMEAYGLPKNDDATKAARAAAIESATRHAIDVPMQVARTAAAVLPIAADMVERGNPNSVTDAGVGAMAARTAVLGAILNAQVNAKDLKDRSYVEEILAECDRLTEEVEAAERTIRDGVARVLKS
jgi:glutamate formiminotransferase/formiminotetrahydrofolate cyclodeaminase